jgi:exonuclease III
VVLVSFINNPTFDQDASKGDKYTISDKIIILIHYSSLIYLPKACQICFEKFLAKQSGCKYLRIHNCSCFLPKTYRIYTDGAHPIKLNLKSHTRTILIIYIESFLFNEKSCPYPIKAQNLPLLNLLLLAGDIETNPGPNKPLISLNSFNARGLKDRLKLKRLLNTCHKLLNSNKDTIIFLQETHLEEHDRASLNLLWHHKYILSPGTNRQCGNVILFDSTWDVLDSFSDNEGRLCVVVLNKYETTYTLINAYAPNNHDLNYFAFLFNKLLDCQTSYPGSHILLGGDFNFVLTNVDSVNRQVSSTETQCRVFFKRNLERFNLIDTFRTKIKVGGYTWARGSCMSRLDMIFASRELVEHITKVYVDWSFDDSDHALVGTNFNVVTQFLKGPGLTRLNVDILDNHYTLEHVRLELKNQIDSIPSHWNPHLKLDFIKVAIRSIISEYSGKQSRKNTTEQDAIKDQLNTLYETKEKLERGEIINGVQLRDINDTIAILETEHKIFLDEQSKKLCLRAQLKWYEEGERSNKYFLNIIKKKSQDKLITKLYTPSGLVTDQENIANHITEFYKDLYNHKETSENYSDLLSECPTLDEADRIFLDKEITLEELQRVLGTCGDSAPGPDGIAYKVYRKLWDPIGPHLLNAWKYSLEIKNLPLDQRRSAITLLPKQGKDLTKIENWRPITLSNCDLKIFTKLLSVRVSKVLDKVIHPCQTAYIPGRVVHDNLRLFDFYNNICKEKDIDALLISLDAKKAFDSVSHKYMHKVLSTYGFSDTFIEIVKILYKDIEAQILVNGHKTVFIKILRSVKQGDALSCALFILCIDPLIRKIANDSNIKPASIPKSRYSDIRIEEKIAGFADDIGLVVNNDSQSIKGIFDTYKIFSNLSGIELNVDKTEILRLNNNTIHSDFVPELIPIDSYHIGTKESIKICGITFSNNSLISYEMNVLDKILKMEKLLIMWLQRPLSFEGRSLIVKTFGLSQLIYSMQMCEINERELIDIERMIFKFLWNKKWIGNPAPDRIKRGVLKLPYERGGLQVPDIFHLDKALKTKQFIRSMASSHPINYVQKYQLEQIGYFEYYKLEYSKFCNRDPIISTYQKSCNFLTDRLRANCDFLPLPELELLESSIDVIASTDVLEFLARKKFLLIINRFSRLSNLGIQTLFQLYNEARFPRSDEIGELAKYILNLFNKGWIEAIKSKPEINSEITYESEFPFLKSGLAPHSLINVKNLRMIFSESMNTPVYPFNNDNKFKIFSQVTHNPFTLIRKAISAPRDRFFKYRILQGDIFCNERLHRFKMSETPYCDYCMTHNNLHIVEDIKHITWDCPRSQSVWSHLKTIVNTAFNQEYINYKTVILGSEEPILVLERLIVLGLKLILVKERTNPILTRVLNNQFNAQFILEKGSNRKHFDRNRQHWDKINMSISLNTG